jgi:hypothetical protein
MARKSTPNNESQLWGYWNDDNDDDDDYDGDDDTDDDDDYTLISKQVVMAKWRKTGHFKTKIHNGPLNVFKFLILS